MIYDNFLNLDNIGSNGVFNPLQANPSSYYPSTNPNINVFTDGAVQFTASDKAYLSIASNATLNLGTGDFAFNIWFLRGATGAKVFATKYQDANNYWEFGVNSSNIPYFTAVVSGSTLISVTGTTAITSTTVWQDLHINISRTDATLCKIYVNGTDDTVAGASTSASSIDNTGSFIVGANGALTVFCQGAKDSFAFNKTLSTTAEISALYNAGAGQMYDDLTSANGLATFQSNLVSWWGFNEEDGTRYDAKGTNHLSQTSTELVTNGSFTGNDTGWNKGADWAYGTNNEVAVTSTADLTQTTVVPTIGHKYKVTYTIGAISLGSLAFTLGGVTGTTRTTTGTYTEYITATSSATLAIHPVSSFTGTIDDVSVTCTEIPATAGIAAGLAIDGNLCATLDGSTQYFTLADISSINPQANKFSLAIWCNPSNVPATGSTGRLISKMLSAGNNYEYNLDYQPNKTFRFELSANGSSTTAKLTTDTLPINNWGWVLAEWDGTNMAVSLNNGTPVSGTFAGPIKNGTATLEIGSYNGGNEKFTGRLDQALIMVGRNFTTGEKAAIFNNGKGVKFADLSSTVKTDAQLISCWDFDRVLGIAADSKGTNTLTNNGTITFGQGVNYIAGTVSKVVDSASTPHNLTQTTIASRPLYVTNVKNGWPMRYYNGVNSALSNSTDLIGTGDVTLAAVIRPDGWGGNGAGVIFHGTVNNSTILRVDVNGYLVLSNQNLTQSGNSSLALGNYYVVVVTRSAAGLVNFYINGVLSGTANQSVGTIVAGTTTYLGNRAAGARGFQGMMSSTIIYPSILNASQIQSLVNFLNQQYLIF